MKTPKRLGKLHFRELDALALRMKHLMDKEDSPDFNSVSVGDSVTESFRKGLDVLGGKEIHVADATKTTS